MNEDFHRMDRKDFLPTQDSLITRIFCALLLYFEANLESKLKSMLIDIITFFVIYSITIKEKAPPRKF